MITTPPLVGVPAWQSCAYSPAVPVFSTCCVLSMSPEILRFWLLSLHVFTCLLKIVIKPSLSLRFIGWLSR